MKESLLKKFLNSIKRRKALRKYSNKLVFDDEIIYCDEHRNILWIDKVED